MKAALLVAGWCRCSAARPDQHSTILIAGQLFSLDNFGLQVFKVLLV
jgi:hypothetical protein